MIRFSLTLCLAICCTATGFAQKPGDKKKPAATTPAAAPKSRVQNVSPDVAEKLIAERKDIVVIDVRTVEEFDMGHIAGAKNISFIDSDFDVLIKEVEGKPVLVHCAAGNRSMRAVQKMNGTGKFPEIFHLTSGFSGWEEAGKTVVKTAKAPK